MTNKKALVYSAVYGIIRDGDKILLVRRYNTGYKDGFFTFPAGHVDQGELPHESMLREIVEEIGIRCEAGSLIPVHAMYRISDSGRTYVDYFFEISKYGGSPENKEPHKCDKIEWFEMDNIPDNTLPHVKTVLGLLKNNVYLSEVREN
jgi:8-oxo-dGTP pyrophosphatase MutT (NUDIX family)